MERKRGLNGSDNPKTFRAKCKEKGLVHPGNPHITRIRHPRKLRSQQGRPDSQRWIIFNI